MPQLMAARPRTPRFFCPALPHPRLNESRCALDEEQTRHARKVLRIREGEQIELFNGQGLTAGATVMIYDAGIAWCQVTWADEQPLPTPQLVVASAVPKGPRLDEMANQLSQLGADVFVPILTERSVVDPREAKLDRLRKLAVESAKQCGRPWLMQVADPAAFGAFIREPSDLKLILHPGDARFDDMPARLRDAQRATLVIGPEGGFTDAELQAAENHEFQRWSIGPNVLRIETAAVAAVSVLRYIAR